MEEAGSEDKGFYKYKTELGLPVWKETSPLRLGPFLPFAFLNPKGRRFAQHGNTSPRAGPDPLKAHFMQTRCQGSWRSSFSAKANVPMCAPAFSEWSRLEIEKVLVPRRGTSQ